MLFRSERRSHQAVRPVVGAALGNSFSDAGLSPNTTYLYLVRATDGSNVSPSSNTDLATTILFTDDPVAPASTIIKAVHVTELRTAVNAVRAAAGLPDATFTDAVSAGVFMKAIHITELRSNLDAARTALGLTAAPYTDPALAAGVIIKAVHIRDLRSRVK